MASIVKEAKYIKSDYKNNNNKFWYIYMFDDNSVMTEYGRVGKNPQSKTKNFYSSYEAEKYFNKKCKEKERSGRNGEIAYRPLDVVADTGEVSIAGNLNNIAEKQIEHDQDTLDLIRYLVKVNVHNIVSNTKISYNKESGLFSTPCGIVTSATISEARSILNKIYDNMKKGSIHTQRYGDLINNYLMLIPQDIGMKRFDPAVLYKDEEDIRKQNGILDSLEASFNSVVSGNIVDSETEVEEPVVFQTKLVKVSDKNIIDSIKYKYENTKKSMHSCSHLKVKNVYEVEIKDMKEKFEKAKNKINNVKELWHGTRASNLLSIMKGGLIIPSSNASHCTGRLFGDGIYFASDSSKSLNYSYGYWSGGNYDKNCFMFLADVAMGKSYTPKGSYERFPKRGYNSTWAKSKVSGVMNDEFIVYDVSQCNLKYLVEFSD